jgi:hypothetical protein
MPTRPFTVIRSQTYEPQGAQVGDQWFNTSTNSLSIALPINGTTLTSTSTLLNVGGNINAGNASLTIGNIIPGAGNVAGNIGTSGLNFNFVFARATSASYADLAEKYSADATYEPGTVVSFGGDKEITLTTQAYDIKIAGVISTNPSFRMNDRLESEHTAMVALQGRVPTKVVGKISKGDRMVASDQAGVATALDPARYEPGCVIGKALEDYDSDQPGTIEVVVGRL